jgi:hypothetical protein
MAKLVITQSPLPAFNGELSNSRCWILTDDVQAGRMPQKPAQRPDRAARDAGAAS